MRKLAAVAMAAALGGCVSNGFRHYSRVDVTLDGISAAPSGDVWLLKSTRTEEWDVATQGGLLSSTSTVTGRRVTVDHSVVQCRPTPAELVCVEPRVRQAKSPPPRNNAGPPDVE